MGEGEFLAELRRLKLEWYLDPEGRLRAHQRPGGLYGTWTVAVCPLAAVSNTTMGTRLTTAYSMAAFALGVPDELALQIVHAADNVAKHNELLRRRLLEACGLKRRVL